MKLYLVSASVADLVEYIEQDVAAIRHEMETGHKLPDYHDVDAADNIAQYGAELKKRGY